MNRIVKISLVFGVVVLAFFAGLVVEQGGVQRLLGKSALIILSNDVKGYSVEVNGRNVKVCPEIFCQIWLDNGKNEVKLISEKYHKKEFDLEVNGQDIWYFAEFKLKPFVESSGALAEIDKSDLEEIYNFSPDRKTVYTASLSDGELRIRKKDVATGKWEDLKIVQFTKGKIDKFVVSGNESKFFIVVDKGIEREIFLGEMRGGEPQRILEDIKLVNLEADDGGIFQTKKIDGLNVVKPSVSVRRNGIGEEFIVGLPLAGGSLFTDGYERSFKQDFDEVQLGFEYMGYTYGMYYDGEKFAVDSFKNGERFKIMDIPDSEKVESIELIDDQRFVVRSEKSFWVIRI